MTTPVPPRSSKEHTATLVSVTAMLIPPKVQEIAWQAVKLFVETREKEKWPFSDNSSKA